VVKYRLDDQDDGRGLVLVAESKWKTLPTKEARSVSDHGVELHEFVSFPSMTNFRVYVESVSATAWTLWSPKTIVGRIFADTDFLPALTDFAFFDPTVTNAFQVVIPAGCEVKLAMPWYGQTVWEGLEQNRVYAGSRLSTLLGTSAKCSPRNFSRNMSDAACAILDEDLAIIAVNTLPNDGGLVQTSQLVALDVAGSDASSGGQLVYALLTCLFEKYQK
jgi:hypothetical protein